MFPFFPLIFLSCPKPNVSSQDLSSQKVLEWQVSSADFLSIEVPRIQSSQQGILSYWSQEQVDIIANTPCVSESSEISATVTSFSGKQLQKLQISPNSFGEIKFSFPIHRTKREISLALQCEQASGEMWTTTEQLKGNKIPLPQIYSPQKWNAKKENSICFLDSLQGYIEMDFRHLGGSQDDDGFHIGMGQQGEWLTLLRSHIHQPIECIELKPNEMFSAPLEIRLRLRKDGLKQELRRIVTPKPSIWVSAPKTLELGAKALLEIKVDNPSAFSLIDLRIQNGKNHTSYKVPISKKGIVTVPFQAVNSGFHQIIASFGKVKTETSVWVEPKQAFAISSPSKLPKNSEELHWLLLSAHTLPEYDEHSTPFSSTQRIHAPSFLRLGDQAKQTILIWDENTGLQENTEPLPLAQFEEDVSIPILLSPSDQVSLQSGTERLYDQSSTQEFTLPLSSQPYYLTTDSNFSAPLISDLLSDLLAPHHPKTDAHFIQRSALAWDSLATQKAPWFDLILERTKENLEWLEVWHQRNGWNNPELDLFVIHSLIEAYKAGLSPKTSFFFSAVDHLCTGGESPRWAHLRWKLQEEQLGLLPCEEIAEPIWQGKDLSTSDLQTEDEWEIWLLERTYSNTYLADAGEHIAPFYEEIPDNPWLQFAIWNWEQKRYRSYHNLRLSISSPQKTLQKGLFHTWQQKNIYASIETEPNTPPITLQVDGIGSLHWGLWQFIPSQRSPSALDNLNISRRLLRLNQEEVPLSDLKTGEMLFLEHQIQGEPNQKLLLSIFPPANLIIFGKDSSQKVIHKEIVLDQTGNATLQMPVLNSLSGSFQFPASQIQKHDMIAHSGDWIIHSL